MAFEARSGVLTKPSRFVSSPKRLIISEKCSLISSVMGKVSRLKLSFHHDLVE